MKPLVLLDCDGILADFVGSVLGFVHQHTGSRPEREAVVSQNIFESIGDKDVERAFSDHAVKAGFCEGIEPYPEALVGFPRLAGVADVHIVTSPWPSPTWTFEREEWLLQHFGIPSNRVHHESQKFLTRGDYLVDDHPKHIREWLLRRRDHYLGHALLWDTPHNRREEGFWRVRSWDELLTIITTSWGVRPPTPERA